MQKDSFVKVIVKDLVVDVRIGLHDHEKADGRSQRIIVNVELFAGVQGYLKDANRETIIDYDDIYSGIKQWSQNGHTELIETYLQDLLGLCFRYEKVTAARVSITKPDIFENADQVGVEVFMTRADWENKQQI
ncbi:MAG: dihydroneopterin aldolase [Rhodospirillales bacterium]|nr:dihydroneopterin aldolase [Rhodospirillales bacterium]